MQVSKLKKKVAWGIAITVATVAIGTSIELSEQNHPVAITAQHHSVGDKDQIVCQPKDGKGEIASLLENKGASDDQCLFVGCSSFF